MNIPSSVAERVVREFDLELAVVVGYDGQSLEIASFGLRPMAKDVAAEWADKIPAALDFDPATKRMNEDYRATPEAKYKEKIDLLRAKLRAVDLALREIAFFLPTVDSKTRQVDLEQVVELKRKAANAREALGEA